jgi:hypothetical protein
MASWLLVWGSVFGALAGTAIGAFGYYAHSRFVNKDPLSLRAVFWVLLAARPKRISPLTLTQPADRKREQTRRAVMAPALSRATGIGIAGLRSSFDSEGESAVHGLPPGLRRHLQIVHRSDQVSACYENSRTLPPRDRWSKVAPAGSPPGEAQFPVPDGREEQVLPLLWEIERNRKTVREFSGNDLLPLKTDAWDRSLPIVRRLAGDVRNKIEDTYADIAVLNQLVWLASEFDRHGPNLRQGYVDLSASIAARLDHLVDDLLSVFS